jgi:hypothetical protein
VRNSLVASFLWPIARFNGSSFIMIAPDGTCDAHISARDLGLLPVRTSGAILERAGLQQSVSAVVTASLRLFLARDRQGAGGLLEVQNNEEILVRPVHELPRMKALYLISILAGLVGLAAFWMSGQRFMPSPDRAVTAADAKTAVAEWISADKGIGCLARADLTVCLTAFRLPPASFWPPATAEAIRRLGLEGVRRYTPPKLNGEFDCVAGNGLMLYNLLSGGYVSVSELQNAGLTREALLKDIDRKGLRDMAGRPPLSRFPDVNRKPPAQTSRPELRPTDGRAIPESPYVHDNLRLYAYRMWCLKQLGCLDAIDTSGAAELLARHQLTASADSSPADAAGLFRVSEPFWYIEDTWAVLFSLQTLGRLDVIDREACIAGLMRCYLGQGDFTGACNSCKTGNPELVQSGAYYALECLVILGAIDRIADLQEWSFTTNWCQYRNGTLVAPFIAPRAIESWAWQLRLEELRSRPRG